MISSKTFPYTGGNMRRVRSGVVFVVTLLALVCVCCAFFPSSASAMTVPEGHVGIVLKWGEAQDQTLNPGWHWHNPISTRIILMDMRWQKYSTQTSAFSKDIQQVDIAVSMSYQIENTGALELYKRVGEDYADKIMLPRLLDALKSTFAKYSAEELISNREKISTEVRDLLEKQLMFYKLNVREVAIEDIDFTDVFTNAIEAKQVATQKKLQVETEQEQQTLVAQAEAERARINAEADAQQMTIRANAEAEAKKIAANAEAYRLETESKYITSKTIQKTLAERWDGVLPKIVGNDMATVLDANSMLDSQAEVE